MSHGEPTREAGRPPADFQAEIDSGRRFEFGDNWRAFLAVLDERRIADAAAALGDLVGLDRLDGRTFVDVGSGSGLSSLTARRMGARVHSFDLDPSSVWCTQELRRRYFPDDPGWKVERGSALDEAYLRSLGRFDIVHSWGVLHHTGQMWQALDRVVSLVKPDGGMICLALYNDQGWKSRIWRWVKKAYCRLPRALKGVILYPVGALLWVRPTLIDFANLRPFHTWSTYSLHRGMSPWHDVVDWVGGYPFEVATPEAVQDFYEKRGFVLRRLKTAHGSLGNNQFVFERRARP